MVGGILLSYYYNVVPSVTIVVIAVAILIGVLAASSARLISKIEIKKQSKTTHNS